MKASDRKAISIPLNGAEYLELETKASAKELSLPACVLSSCGLPPWIARGREMASRPRQPARLPSQALERLSVTVILTGDEYNGRLMRSRDAGTTVPQYIRTRCGFEVRNTSFFPKD